MNYYTQVFKKYNDFKGRARRKEYWLFALYNVIITIILSIIDGVFGTYKFGEGGLGIISGIYTLIILVPVIALSVRRLHDTNRSGWWLLLAFIPLIGSLILLYFTLLDSNPGSNKYGPNPKGVSDEPKSESAQS